LDPLDIQVIDCHDFETVFSFESRRERAFAVAWVATDQKDSAIRLRRRVGGALHPRNVTRVLYDLFDAAGIRRRRFHDLRHSAASLLIAESVELVEVSKLLGHTDIRITGSLYIHLVKQTAAKSARVMDAVLSR